ncbi:MAG: hypothetical protein JWO52_2465 [Gammaproteobacteria bacterium]|nr:hypothetical protein [Gammaproteobacteria bacterium]
MIDRPQATGEGPAAVVRERAGATTELVRVSEELPLIIEQRVAVIDRPPATDEGPAAVIEEPAVASEGPAVVTE